ncbi:MAG: phosphoglycolate phosphatase [Chloroflexi bacterium]|nr:MAG: phosphoglycolate phosphatase [Chloroflexota bacterium]
MYYPASLILENKMVIDLGRVKGLCFDIDGTLSDTDDEWVSRMTALFSHAPFLFTNGNPITFARWLVMVTESPMNGVYHLLDRLSLDDEFARLYSRLSQKRMRKPHPFQLMKGARELLDLVQGNHVLTVVSARDSLSTQRFLDQYELNTYFSKVVTSQTCEYTKPFPHPVRHAAQAMGLNPESCVMIGDTTVDILAGKAAGAQTIGLLCGFGTEKELLKAGADIILKDLIELKKLFE